ncbi:phosphatase PAP2 family protein [Paenibacillus thermoaerophilus]|uniref:Phosphatase PAP2 family protein n=1 Tax=Paenibacillus thermoaerophilus TaxID=1215385 RepID=A0ABW2UWZ8_9BACL|nr:phosphatase PAP2 family protein [Paenibacillus thermoaerophilus]TMV17310.1 phosphatase PAP2 family protein [Paenibacillus thermoaerophilus]
MVFTGMLSSSVWTAVTVAAILWISLRRQPLAVAYDFGKHLITSRSYLMHFLAMLGILAFNKIEVTLENSMEHTPDFTPYIYKLEGGFVAALQDLFHQNWLTPVLAFFYVVVFQVMLVGSIGVYTFGRELHLYRAVCYAIMMNYMIAIPFYLFLPVTEVHAFSPDVKFYMLDAFPTFETTYRNLSDLDNCFPSLHTSISVTLSIIAFQSRNAFFRLFVPVSAVIVIFSIFYLGIHWLTDMLGGLLLGWFSARSGLRLAVGQPIFGGAAAFGGKKQVLRERP